MNASSTSLTVTSDPLGRSGVPGANCARNRLYSASASSRLHAPRVRVRRVAALKGLTQLTPDRTRATDEGLKALAALASLTELHLEGTTVTDVGLKELARLKTLTLISLKGTGVSDAGVKEF